MLATIIDFNDLKIIWKKLNSLVKTCYKSCPEDFLNVGTPSGVHIFGHFPGFEPGTITQYQADAIPTELSRLLPLKINIGSGWVGIEKVTTLM